MYPHQISDPLALTSADFERMAVRAFEALPEAMRALSRDIEIFIADFAEPDVLDEFEMTDPYELTGLYSGVDLTQKSITQPQTFPDRVFLYRLPILAEWVARGNETIEHLIQHVLIHEIGHHFGLSDEDMHAIEDGLR